MMLSQNLREYVSACFTGIWIQSHEHSDALHEIAQLCRAEKWALATWDVDRGLTAGGHAVATASDPVAAIKSVNTLKKKQAKRENLAVKIEMLDAEIVDLQNVAATNMKTVNDIIYGPEQTAPTAGA